MNKLIWLLFTTITVVVVLLVVYIISENTGGNSKNGVDNFKECEKAGGKIAESYPRQCVLAGQVYIEEVDDLDKGPENTSYMIDGESFKLVNGQAEKEVAPGSASKDLVRVFSVTPDVDLDGDRDKDAIVILTRTSGGSGIFYYIAVAVRVEQGYLGTNAIFVGDRISPQQVNFMNNTIAFNYADRYPWESFNQGTSVGKTKYVTFTGSSIEEVEKEGLSVSVAERLMKRKWGKCEECDSVKVDVFDGENDTSYASITYDGLKDDSKSGLRIVNVVHNVNNNWTLGDTVKKQYQCQLDRGQQEFGDEVCI